VQPRRGVFRREWTGGRSGRGTITVLIVLIRPAVYANLSAAEAVTSTLATVVFIHTHTHTHIHTYTFKQSHSVGIATAAVTSSDSFIA